MSRRRWKMMDRAKAAGTLEALKEISREIEQKQSSSIKVVDPIIKHPVEIFENGKWITVDKSSRDFPIAVKMTITPEWALEIMTDRNPKNRQVRSDRVEKYINDILNGHWTVINNGLGFYEDGTLADGQHRLWAVVESQRPVEMLVVWGMDRASMPNIDEGAARTTKDVANMMGVNARHSDLSIANYILEYRGTRRTTPRGEQIAFYERHVEAVQFVANKLKRPGVAKAPVMAAIARAWYNVDRDGLARFIEILETGTTYEPKDKAAIVLREYLLRNNNNAGPARAEAYRKTQAALVAFMEGNEISRLYGLKDEQFPLPEERLQTKAVPA